MCTYICMYTANIFHKNYRVAFSRLEETESDFPKQSHPEGIGTGNSERKDMNIFYHETRNSGVSRDFHVADT